MTTRRKRKAAPPAPVFEVGNRVRIGGGHPDAGRYGVVERLVTLLGKPAVEIKFNERGDGAIVFARHTLIRL